MSQRNPMNERYQNADEHKGKSRRSAASAKPVSKAASSVRIEGAKKPEKTGFFGQKKRPQESAESRAAAREERARYYDPGTPEYKKWRRYWWITIASALVLTILSFAMQMWLPADIIWVSYVMLGLGYALLIASIAIDLVKVRKIRKGAAASAAGSRSKEATRQRKAAKAAAKKAEEERAQREALDAAKRAAAKENRSNPLGGLKAKFAKKDSAE